MFKPKTPPKERQENSSGGAIRYPLGALTHDLRVMSSNLISRTLDLQVTIYSQARRCLIRLDPA